MATPYTKLPFAEAITFFRSKLNLPTDSWTDIWQGAHSQAFVVAGATKERLLVDIRKAVDDAIANGTGIEKFRDAFRETVAKNGWDFNGGFNWRTRVIYNTNIRQAYNAGREKQMQNPELRKLRPYALYRHGDSAQPRQTHVAWDGTVLLHDDPWWNTHTPSNGWGCSCKKFMVNDRDLKRLGLSVSAKAPQLNEEERTVGVRGPNPRTVTTPAGIDPGFAYNVGDQPWGTQQSVVVTSNWSAGGANIWQISTEGNWQLSGLPRTVSARETKIGSTLTSTAAKTAALKKLFKGADEKVYDSHGAVLVNAESLVPTISNAHSKYIPAINDALTNPDEIWLSFDEHKKSNTMVMRRRIIKALKVDGEPEINMVLNVSKGFLESIEFLVPDKVRLFNISRQGSLLFKRTNK